MHASLDHARDTTIDTLDVARTRASDLVTTGAERLVDTIGRGADGLESRIDQMAERIPALTIEVEHHRRRWPLVLVAGILVIAGLVIARRITTRNDRDIDDHDDGIPTRH